MGNVVSSGATLPPLSIVSISIGFATFANTILTTLKVFWKNVETASAAKQSSREFLGSLGTALHEERQLLRRIRRKIRRKSMHGDEKLGLRRRSTMTQQDLQDDEEAWEALAKVNRALCKQWSDLTAPFLVEDGEATWFDEEFGRRRAVVDGMDGEGRCWRRMTLPLRWLWVRRKGKAEALSQRFSRLQTRRIARQVAYAGIAVTHIQNSVDDINDAVGRIEHRLANVMGVRRID